MYTLGELGIALGLAWLVFSRRRETLDFRLVLLGSILPDLIDKPLGAVLQLEARLWAHTLLFLAAILLASLAPRTRWLAWVGFGVAVHLLVDLMWLEPDVALWPLYGWGFPSDGMSVGGYLDILLHDPYVQFGEITGGLILAATAWRYRITSWAALRKFLRDGKLERPTQGAPSAG